ncbi:hypothetical protein ACRJ4W_23805 [Streptomyces sp. GLT-R25]
MGAALLEDSPAFAARMAECAAALARLWSGICWKSCAPAMVWSGWMWCSRSHGR